MVRGLELFRGHFHGVANRYVLIGGVACDLILGDAGLPFRVTQDLDIVLCVEALDRTFAEVFWAFVEGGGYQAQEAATGRRRFYRFVNPEDHDYPAMLELFSRVPDALSIPEGSHLTPIPVDAEVASLSAILLDATYYDWIHAGRREVKGVPIIGAEYLIPLKARAWLDLTDRAAAGASIDSKSIRKHKNDVFRLFQVIDPEARPHPPARIVEDVRSFLGRMEAETVDLAALGLRSWSRAAVLNGLRSIYMIS